MDTENTKSSEEVVHIKKCIPSQVVDATSSSTSPCSKRSMILGELEDELERQLEEKAKRNELSAQNVKSLLRAVLIDEDVLKYVDYALNKTHEQPEFQMKLTRAKAKELIDKIPDMAPLLCLPTPKKQSDIDVLINEDLPEDSSDEEYKPLDDVVDDYEGESTIMSPRSEPEPPATPSAENIGQRTRSKLSLSETPLEAIEQAFMPPDITEDMYNTDCDNQDWLNFLKDLVQPLDATKEVNDEDDPEYNILGDEEFDALDNEELRADRAVKISKKEVNELMYELFEYTQMHEDGYCSDEENPGETEENLKKLITQQPVTQTLPQEVVITVATPSPAKQKEEETPLSPVGNDIEEEQILLIQQQIMQHVQLILQTYLLCLGNPFVNGEDAVSCTVVLEDIKRLSEEKSMIWSHIPTIRSSFDLISRYELYARRNHSELVKWNEETAARGTYKKTKWAGSPAIHPQLMSYCVRSDAFQFPLLLPKIGFKQSDSVKSRFSPAEDNLIALGLHDCIENLDIDASTPNGLSLSCRLVQEALLPSRSVDEIVSNVNRKKRSKLNNPVQDLFNFGMPPGVEHFVIPVDPYKKLPLLYQQDVRLIDMSWHRTLYQERDCRNAKRKLNP